MLSIFYAEQQILKNAGKAYYKMPVRACEMFLGALICFLPKIKLKETIENDSSCEVFFICKYGGSLTSQSISIDRIELNNFINELRNEIKAQAKKIGATPAMVESTI